MEQYEYCIKKVQYTVNLEYNVDAWNEFGKHGWEMVTIIVDNNYLMEAIFKRKITQSKNG